MKAAWEMNPPLGTWPTIVLIVAVTALLVWDYVRRGRGTAQITAAGYLGLRLMALAALAVTGFAPVRVREQSTADGVGTGEIAPAIVLQDVSESLGSQEQEKLAIAAETLTKTAGARSVRWIRFAGRTEVSFEKVALETGATDISEALLAASIYHPGAIILLSDGLWNRGTDPVVVAREAELPPVGAVYLKQEKIGQVGFAPYGYSGDNTVKTGVIVPEKVSAGEEFVAKVRLYPGSGGGRLKVRLKGPVDGRSNEVSVATEQTIEINGGEGIQERTVKMTAGVQGTWLVEAEFVPQDKVASGGVLSQTAVTHVTAGPLRVVFFQGRLGWDAAALFRLMEGGKDVRMKKVRGYAGNVEAPAEVGDVDVLVICGYPHGEIPPAWKAAMISYADAGKGVLFAGRATEYVKWEGLSVRLPKMVTAEPPPTVTEARDSAILSSEMEGLLERSAALGAIVEVENVQIAEGVTPVIIGKKTGRVLAGLKESRGQRVAWFAEPPLSTILGRTEAGNNGNARGVFLDLLYYLGHRKRRPDELNLLSQRPSAKIGETVALILGGLDVRNTNNVTLYTNGPEGEKTRRMAQENLKREMRVDGRVLFREKLPSPGLYLFRISAGMSDGRTLWAGAACMVRGADIEKMEYGTNEVLLRKVAEETKGVAEGFAVDKAYSPSPEMVKMIKDAVSSGPAHAKADIFEVYRWWPVLLILILALFLEWALRTR